MEYFSDIDNSAALLQGTDIPYHLWVQKFKQIRL